MKYETVACERGGRTGSDRNRSVGFVSCVTFTRELGVFPNSNRLTSFHLHRVGISLHDWAVSSTHHNNFKRFQADLKTYESSAFGVELLGTCRQLAHIQLWTRVCPDYISPDDRTKRGSNRPHGFTTTAAVCSHCSALVGAICGRHACGRTTSYRNAPRDMGRGGERWIVGILCVAAVGVDRRDPRLCSLEQLRFTLCGIYLSIHLSIPIGLAD